MAFSSFFSFIKLTTLGCEIAHRFEFSLCSKQKTLLEGEVRGIEPFASEDPPPQKKGAPQA